MTPDGTRGIRLLTLSLAAALLALATLTGPASAPLSESGGTGEDGGIYASGAPASRPATTPFGAYLGYGPAGVRRIAGLAGWLGRGAPAPRVGREYLPGDRWKGIEGSDGQLSPWGTWRRARPDRLFVLNVPMLPRNESHLPDRTVRTELRRGAQGRYDAHFRALAERLVRLGLSDTVLVVGWEMNGITYTHRCGPDPAAWRTYWRRIVRAMRAVPGQHFRFDFAPNRGRDAIPWPRCYPGDPYVDIIGMDTYDSPHGMPFRTQLREPYGLAAQLRFARTHGKPVSYPEWGLYKNGDNSAYMKGMLAWIARVRPVYQSITDYCPHGVWRCGGNSRASGVYRRGMG
ncbi:glycoside hydrolase family 26 protein [Streptomyces sp. NPDC001002]